MELRLTGRHAVALNFVLIVALAYFAALSVNDIIARSLSGGDIGEKISAAPAPREPGINTRAYYETIVTRDIFNLMPQAEVPQPVVEEDLHLKLLGTALSKERPFAIVEDAGGNQSLYGLGQDIPGAGKLVAVEKDRATIDHGGRRIAIEIANDEPSSANPGSDVGVKSALDASEGLEQRHESRERRLELRRQRRQDRKQGLR